MAEQGLMAPLPLILQPCSDSYQSNVEASLPDLLSVQVGGLHIQRCNDEIAQCISVHLLLVQHRAGHVQRCILMRTTLTLQGVCRANITARAMQCLAVS